MPSVLEIIRRSGKGLNESKEFVYLLDISLGTGLGTYSCANISKDSEGEFYKSKIVNSGSIRHSIVTETGEFENSDFSISLANSDLEYSKYPWNLTTLNKLIDFRIGFVGGLEDGLEYLADGIYFADGSIYANGSPQSTGMPGNVSVGYGYTLFKGIIKSEERSNKEFKLSVGDYTKKIFRDIPPRIITVNEFPYIGTSVNVGGTKTDADTGLVGKGIPYIYGDFSYENIKPIFADTLKKRYLIADHSIGTVVKVISGGTQVYNFIHPNISGYVAGTHLIGTNIMSYIDFGTSQGTKNVYVSIKGRYDNYGTLIENPANILKDILLSKNICDLSNDDIGTASFDTTQNWLNQFKFRYIMDGNIHKNSIDFIHNLNMSSLSNFYFDRTNKANFVTYRPAVSRNYIQKVNQQDILEDTFVFTKNINDVYNKVIVNYNYDYIKKEYRDVYEVNGTAYIDKFDTVKTFTVDSPLIYTSSEAKFMAQKWLSRLQGGVSRVQFSCALNSFPIDVGDNIHLTHDEPPSVVGGWNDRLLNIIESEIDTSNKQINIVAEDSDEINISKRFFILGNNVGGFYYDADESERYYGALCSSSGVMSNGDNGYILW